MSRPYPVYMRIRLNVRLYALYRLRQLSLGVYEVYLGKKPVRIEYRRDMRTHQLGKLSEYAYYLATLFRLQFAYAVVGLYHLRRLNKNRLAGCRLVVHDAADAAFQTLADRNHQAAVAHGGRHVLVDQPLALGRAQDSIQSFRNRPLCACKFTAYARQFRRRRVFYPPELVEYLVNASHQLRKRRYTIRQTVERRIRMLSVLPFTVSSTVQVIHYGAYSVQ